MHVYVNYIYFCFFPSLSIYFVSFLFYLLGNFLNFVSQTFYWIFIFTIFSNLSILYFLTLPLYNTSHFFPLSLSKNIVQFFFYLAWFSCMASMVPNSFLVFLCFKSLPLLRGVPKYLWILVFCSYLRMGC